MKRIIIALCLVLGVVSCNKTEEPLMDRAKQMEQTSKSEIEFSNGTTLSLHTKHQVRMAARANNQTQELKAYFFIREDGATPRSNEAGEQSAYWPQGQDYLGNPTGKTKEGTMKENEGRFFFDSQYYDTFTSKKFGTTYCLKDGVATRPFLVGDFDTTLKDAIPGTGIPNIDNLIKQKGCPLTFDSQTDTVIWYAIKNREVASGHFHIDGIIKKKNDLIAKPKDYVEITIPDLERGLFIEADDFAIRVDGKYIDDIIPYSNKVERYGIMSEDNLTIRVDNLSSLDFEKHNEYTYEVWLWAKEAANWDTHIEECLSNNPSGYNVRYDVYKGIGGHNDTSYIKVSIHITSENRK